MHNYPVCFVSNAAHYINDLLEMQIWKSATTLSVCLAGSRSVTCSKLWIQLRLSTWTMSSCSCSFRSMSLQASSKFRLDAAYRLGLKPKILDYVPDYVPKHVLKYVKEHKTKLDCMLLAKSNTASKRVQQTASRKSFDYPH